MVDIHVEEDGLLVLSDRFNDSILALLCYKFTWTTIKILLIVRNILNENFKNSISFIIANIS